MSRTYVFTKMCLFKSDRNHLKFKDLTQRCLIYISAVGVSDSAKSALALSEKRNTASALSETALSLHQRCRR
jgi:hypothetical protein